MPSNDNDPTSTMIVTLTVGQLKRVVGEAVREHCVVTTPREFLTPKQLAERLGVTPASIKTMVLRDGLPAHTLGPKLQRFLWTEVEQWLATRDVKPAADGVAEESRPLSPLRHMRRLK